MVAVSPNFRGDLKISDQNNWGGGGGTKGEKKKIGGGGGGGGGQTEQKNKFREELNLKGDQKFYRRPMDPNDVMVVVLKDILLFVRF